MDEEAARDPRSWEKANGRELSCDRSRDLAEARAAEAGHRFHRDVAVPFHFDPEGLIEWRPDVRTDLPTPVRYSITVGETAGTLRLAYQHDVTGASLRTWCRSRQRPVSSVACAGG